MAVNNATLKFGGNTNAIPTLLGVKTLFLYLVDGVCRVHTCQYVTNYSLHLLGVDSALFSCD